jgi:hypothetical protein
MLVLMRLVVLLTASVIATAAPLRAWCEATCLAPAHHADASAKPHCPTGEPADGDPKISAGNLDDCPIIEAARPTTFAKLDLAPARLTASSHGAAPEPPGSRAPSHSHAQAPRRPSFIPLRV